MRSNGTPDKVTMDQSGANKAAIDQIIEHKEIAVIVRQVKYLNNIVEQDHRAVKRVTRPMQGFKSFRSARNILSSLAFFPLMRQNRILVGLVTSGNERPRGKPRGINTGFKTADLQSAFRRKRRGIGPEEIKTQALTRLSRQK